MLRKEANLQNPLRILDRAIRGGLGKGHLGVIAGPVGAGKSACLAQLGLDALMRDRSVLHVALGRAVEHVSAWYDAQFEELAERVDLAQRGGVREALRHRRLIWSLPEAAFDARALGEALAAFRGHLAPGPAVILVDGFRWDGSGREALGAIKASAAGVGAELWMSASDPGGRDPRRLGALPVLPDECAALVDVALLLEPHGRLVRITLVKGPERSCAVDLPLVLQDGVLRLLRDDDGAAPLELPPDACTLLATSSVGAEEEFGRCAERWGVHEVNFTFGGRHETGRTRGLVELGEDELKLGEVSAAYVKAHMHRSFSDVAVLERVLQAIWHQVSRAGEVFSVGVVNPDKTAHGGTGWAIELARHWRKPVHLFDQEHGQWLRWSEPDWIAEAPPVITRVRFAGAGTRAPSEGGRTAIRELFERSFGAPPA